MARDPDEDLVAHMLVPPPAPAARRCPSISSGSRQRANSARWSQAIWEAEQAVMRPPGPAAPPPAQAAPAQAAPPPAHSAPAHLAALSRSEAMGSLGNALQPLHQLLWQSGTGKGALRPVGVVTVRQRSEGMCTFSTLPGVRWRLQPFPGTGWEPPPHTHTHPSPNSAGKLGRLDPVDTPYFGGAEAYAPFQVSLSF